MEPVVLHEKTRNKQKAHRLSDTPKQKGFRRLPTLQSPKTGGHIITQERGVKTALIKHMGPLGGSFQKRSVLLRILVSIPVFWHGSTGRSTLCAPFQCRGMRLPPRLHDESNRSLQGSRHKGGSCCVRACVCNACVLVSVQPLATRPTQRYVPVCVCDACALVFVQALAASMPKRGRHR